MNVLFLTISGVRNSVDILLVCLEGVNDLAILSVVHLHWPRQYCHDYTMS